MSNKVTMYDPPAGWRYGFPREYKPLPEESLADTLRRDGYPKKELDYWGEHIPCSFFQKDIDA